MLQSLKLRPGITKDITDLSNSGGWYDSDKVRFRMGYPCLLYTSDAADE